VQRRSQQSVRNASQDQDPYVSAGFLCFWTDTIAKCSVELKNFYHLKTQKVFSLTFVQHSSATRHFWTENKINSSVGSATTATTAVLWYCILTVSKGGKKGSQNIPHFKTNGFYFIKICRTTLYVLLFLTALEEYAQGVVPMYISHVNLYWSRWQYWLWVQKGEHFHLLRYQLTVFCFILKT
jgi:hypothetical protein